MRWEPVWNAWHTGIQFTCVGVRENRSGPTPIAQDFEGHVATGSRSTTYTRVPFHI